MTLEQIEKRLDDIADDLNYANIVLTEAEGSTICPVKYHEAREQFSHALKSLANFRGDLHMANYIESFNTFNTF